jgi:hypothetical protein
VCVTHPWCPLRLVHLSTLARDMEDRYNKLTKDMAE